MIASILGSMAGNLLQSIFSTQSSNKNNNFETEMTFQKLSSSVKSGNLNEARQAFAHLAKLLPPEELKNPHSALAQIGNFLQAGDVGAAQKTLATIA